MFIPSLRDALLAALRQLRSGFMVLGGVALAGCEDQPTTTTTMAGEDGWRFVQAPMAKDGLPVSVSGSPFGDGPSAVSEAVLAAMHDATTWTATPRYIAGGSGASVRVIVTFNGGSRTPCGRFEAGGGPQNDGRADVLMTLCGGDRELTQVSGHVTGADGLADPKFDALIRQATRELLRPPRRDDR